MLHCNVRVTGVGYGTPCKGVSRGFESHPALQSSRRMGATQFGAMAELAIALPCKGRACGFESHSPLQSLNPDRLVGRKGQVGLASVDALGLYVEVAPAPRCGAKGAEWLRDSMTEELKIWIAVRQDLPQMTPGKTFTQVGHAVDMVLEQAEAQRPLTLKAYREAARPKITCRLDDLAHMSAVYEQCRKAGLPAAFVVDAGRTIFNEPTATVFAVGPCYRSELPSKARRLQLLVEKLPETAEKVDEQGDGTVS